MKASPYLQAALSATQQIARNNKTDGCPRKLIHSGQYPLVITPPAILARAIKSFAPGLMERSALNVLILGARQVECLDDAQWYRYLPALLGPRERTISVTVAGDALVHNRESKVANLLSPRGRIPVRIVQGHAQTLLDESEWTAFDVAIHFAMGPAKATFEGEERLLKALARAGKPIFMTDFSYPGSAVNGLLASAIGLKVSHVTMSGYGMPEGQPGLSWGSTLMLLQAAEHSMTATAPDLHALAQSLMAVVQQACQAGFTNQEPGMGKVYAEPIKTKAGQLRLQHVMNGLAIELDTGRLVHVRGGRGDIVATLPVDSLPALPNPDRPDFLQRHLWAMRVFNELIQPAVRAHSEADAA